MGVRRPFHLSLFLTAPRVVLTQDPSTNAREIDRVARVCPVLQALWDHPLVGGISAGAMMQPSAALFNGNEIGCALLAHCRSAMAPAPHARAVSRFTTLTQVGSCVSVSLRVRGWGWEGGVLCACARACSVSPCPGGHV